MCGLGEDAVALFDTNVPITFSCREKSDLLCVNSPTQKRFTFNPARACLHVTIIILIVIKDHPNHIPNPGEHGTQVHPASPDDNIGTDRTPSDDVMLSARSRDIHGIER